MNDKVISDKDARILAEEAYAIAHHRIYVSDSGAISCDEDTCACFGDVFGAGMQGRRHVLQDFITAVTRHRKDNMPKPLPPERVEPVDMRCNCSACLTRRDG